MLPDFIGPADSYDVKVEGSFSDLMNSRLDRLRITGRNVLFLRKYPVDELLLEMKNIRFDMEARTLKSAESTSLSAVMYESSLLRYVAREHPDLGQAHIVISEGFVVATAEPELAHLSAQVEAVGKLRIRDGVRVDFVVEKVSVGGLPMPAAVANTIENQFNPVLNLSDCPLPITLTSIKMAPGKVALTGTADLTHGLPAGFSLTVKKPRAPVRLHAAIAVKGRHTQTFQHPT